MFIRQVKKQRSKDSKVFYQYTLAQTSRVEGRVKQRNILYLGSDPILENKENRTIVLSILTAKIFGEPSLFIDTAPKELADLASFYYHKYEIKYGAGNHPVATIPPAPARAEFHNIDIKGLDISDVKTFGTEHLCKQVLDKLELKAFFTSLGMNEKQASKALLGIASRAIFSSSEYKTSQILETNSELQHCFNIEEKITHKQLYTIADTLYSHKKEIDAFLYNRISTLFNLEDKLVIFDISNTYFETRKSNSKIAKYGRSKEKRSDCPLVVFTGVINAQGFIRHSRIYEGNTADMATLDDMITDLSTHSPNVKQTIVIDAGIASEDNLALIKNKGYNYVCVSRKRLKDYPLNIAENKVTQLTDRDKNEVALAIFKPEGYDDTWMYVQSEAKRLKENSMNEKLQQRFEEDITSIQKAITTKGGTKKINKVWERIGRAKQKHSRVSANYVIEVTQSEGVATELSWSILPAKPAKEDKTKGVYFIRTNYENPTEKEVWDIYNTIREVEATFRCLKSDLNIRPLHHQKDHRIESHIYLTILAYQLVNTIRHMLKNQGINHSWTTIVRLMSTHTIQTVELPTDKKTIHLRKPSKPIEQVQQIYSATKCRLTQAPVKKYVVYH